MTNNKKITSIIGTHNSRLRCLIIKLFNNSNKKNNSIKKQQFIKYRWQNCAVLKLKLKPVTNSLNTKFLFNLSLCYEGEIDKQETKEYDYWSFSNKVEYINEKLSSKVDNPKRSFHLFEPLKGHIKLSDIRDVDNSQIIYNNLDNYSKISEFTFYFVRHGQAIHNLYNKWNFIRIKDTKITDIGKEVAIKAGIKINEDLQKNKDKISFYFVSDLIRTRQTLHKILENINPKYLTFTYINNPIINSTDSNKKKSINLIVLPCAHELIFRKNGQCDTIKTIKQVFTLENEISCNKLGNYPIYSKKYKDCVATTLHNKFDSKLNILVNNNWDIYHKFYGNEYKRYLKYNDKCKPTSMIEESIKIISNIINSPTNNILNKTKKKQSNFKIIKTKKTQHTNTTHKHNIQTPKHNIQTHKHNIQTPKHNIQTHKHKKTTF